MLALWFYHADESDPTNATISNYIREQHAPGTAVSPPALLYRLLIRPWLKKKNSSGSVRDLFHQRRNQLQSALRFPPPR